MYPGKTVWLFGALALQLAIPGAYTETVLYVDQNASGPIHDGTSWCSVLTEAHAALAVATASRIYPRSSKNAYL